MNDGKDKLKIWQFFTFKLNLTLKFKVNYPPQVQGQLPPTPPPPPPQKKKKKKKKKQNNRDINQGVLLLWSKFCDSSLNAWQVIARTSKWLPHTQTHRQTDAANDNTRRPKLASGKNVIFNLGIFKSSYDNVLRWMPQDLTDDKSTLVQVMAWCHQTTSHYTWISVDQDLQCHMASLGPNELMQWAPSMHTFTKLIFDH